MTNCCDWTKDANMWRKTKPTKWAAVSICKRCIRSRKLQFTGAKILPIEWDKESEEYILWLGRKHQNPNLVELIGGTREDEETALETVIRETYEETGQEVSKCHLYLSHDNYYIIPPYELGTYPGPSVLFIIHVNWFPRKSVQEKMKETTEGIIKAMKKGRKVRIEIDDLTTLKLSELKAWKGNDNDVLKTTKDGSKLYAIYFDKRMLNIVKKFEETYIYP